MASRRIPKSANDLTAILLVEIPKAVKGARAWRLNVGGAYPIQSIQPVIAALKRGDWRMALEMVVKVRPRMFGAVGLPDIDGIMPDGRRLGVEVKWGKDTQSEQQKVCQKVYEDRGAVYIIARDVDLCLAELKAKAGISPGQPLSI